MEFKIKKIKFDPLYLKNYHKSWINLELNGSPVDAFAPLWTDGGKNSGPLGSLHPAAFPMGKNLPRFIVTIVLVNSLPLHGGDYCLAGYTDKRQWGVVERKVFSGEVKAGARGEVEVEVTLDYKPIEFISLVMEFGWRLEPAKATGMSAKKGTREQDDKDFPVYTFLEFYWLYDGLNEQFFWRGVPVRLLRFLAPVCQVFDLSADWYQELVREPKLVISSLIKKKEPPEKFPKKHKHIGYIVKALFFRNPPRYDIYFGARHYTDFIEIQKKKESSININAFLDHFLDSLHEDGTNCNCQDQAAILFIFLSAIGIGDLKVCIMNPFGYMRLSNLVGRGLCNNPRYRDQRTARILEPNNPTRASFGFHSFCIWEDKWILDACIGPHKGNEDKEKYVGRAIDYSVLDNQKSVGTAKDIKSFPVDLSLDYIQQRPEDEEPKGSNSEVFVFRSWPDPRACPLLGTDWEFYDEKIVAGDIEVRKCWGLRRKGETILIRLYLFSSGDASNLLWRYHQIKNSNFDDSNMYSQGPSYLGDYVYRSVSENPSRFLWIPQFQKGLLFNLVFDVVCKNVNFNVEALVVWLNELALSSKVTDIEPYLPSSTPIVINPKTHRVGDLITLTFKLATSEYIIVESRLIAGNGLRFVSQELSVIQEDPANMLYEMKMLALNESDNTVRIVLVDQDSFLSSKKDVKIQVKSG